ncbi:MAG: ABC transporter substrate-binding protein [Desulforhopalus sp.]
MKMSVLNKTTTITKRLYRISTFLILLCWLIIPAPSLADNDKTIIDSSGQTVHVPKPFTRIISLYSAHTENLCSLGAEDLLVGISRSDDSPPSIIEKPRFSYREDPEKFIGLHPDLVLVRPMIERSYPQFINKLKQAGIAVISLQPNSVDEMFGYWENLGILTGHEAQAREMITVFKSRLKLVQDSLSEIQAEQRPRVYFQSIHKKMKTFAPESIGAFVLEQAGGINIAADAEQVRNTNIAFYGKERLLSRGSTIDIFIAQRGKMNPVDIATITNEPGFKAIKAVREKRVYLIEEALVSRPTLRILDGIEQLHALFYPPEETTRQKGK